MNTYYQLKGEKQVDKGSELVKAVKQWVDEEYAGGRVTVLTDDELVAVIEKNCEEMGISLG